MRNRIQFISIRSVVAVKVVAIAAVMAFAGPALNSTSVATAQAKGIPQLELRIGPHKLCPFFCFVPGLCCEVEGVL